MIHHGPLQYDLYSGSDGILVVSEYTEDINQDSTGNARLRVGQYEDHFNIFETKTRRREEKPMSSSHNVQINTAAQTPIENDTYAVIVQTK